MAVCKNHQDREGLVIILYALGIKEIENRDEAFGMLENWETVYDVFRNAIESQSQQLKQHNLTAGVDFKGFSDTIIISLPVTIRPKTYRDLTNRDDHAENLESALDQFASIHEDLISK